MENEVLTPISQFWKYRWPNWLFAATDRSAATCGMGRGDAFRHSASCHFALPFGASRLSTGSLAAFSLGAASCSGLVSGGTSFFPSSGAGGASGTSGSEPPPVRSAPPPTRTTAATPAATSDESAPDAETGAADEGSAASDAGG
eukprot:CAMPEP_0198496042 /NCGR_PEP_ID=MMETSP1462-20131121/5582_1 /TAXON_ID=1333877 /ORGANISM="Brandtodinium nutriculum, Strain RCC3387" /LENGTH=143 /DNA_ID=CAMNT_0044224851 /DNA_START=264 /DNA_END=693 /DNA_ORIENTATION=+